MELSSISPVTITKADDDGTEIVLGEPLQFTPENVADYAKLY